MRTGGAQQLTFDGAPLYTFVKDKKPGDMTGQGLDVAGGYWWAVAVAGHAAPRSAGGYWLLVSGCCAATLRSAATSTRL